MVNIQAKLLQILNKKGNVELILVEIRMNDQVFKTKALRHSETKNWIVKPALSTDIHFNANHRFYAVSDMTKGAVRILDTNGLTLLRDLTSYKSISGIDSGVVINYAVNGDKTSNLINLYTLDKVFEDKYRSIEFYCRISDDTIVLLLNSKEESNDVFLDPEFEEILLYPYDGVTFVAKCYNSESWKAMNVYGEILYIPSPLTTSYKDIVSLLDSEFYELYLCDSDKNS